MADFSIGEAVLTGPTLFRRRPGVLAIWVAFQLLTAIIIEGVLIMFAGPALNRMAHMNPKTDTTQVIGMFGQILPGYLIVLLLSMATFAVTCAAGQSRGGPAPPTTAGWPTCASAATSCGSWR